MWKTTVIFLSISLGTLLSAGPPEHIWYDFQYVEVVLFIIFFFLLVNNHNSGIKIQMSLMEKIIFLMFPICCFYAVSTYFWSDYGVSVIPGSVSIFIGFITFIVAKVNLKESIKSYDLGNRVLLLSIVLQLLLNINLNFVGSFYSLKNTSFTLMGSSNYLSIFLGFFFLYELISRKKYWLWFTLISMIAIFLTLSKGAILSISGSLLVYISIMLFNSKIKKFKTIIILFLLTAIAFYIFDYTSIGIELLTNLDYAMNTGYTSGRSILIEDAFNQILIHPFGNGIVINNDPHNIVLKCLRDLGIFVGLIYLVILIHPLYHLFNFKIFSYSKATLALLIGYLSVVSHSLVEIFYFNSTSIVWTVFTLVAINKMIIFEKEQKILIIQSKNIKNV